MTHGCYIKRQKPNSALTFEMQDFSAIDTTGHQLARCIGFEISSSSDLCDVLCGDLQLIRGDRVDKRAPLFDYVDLFTEVSHVI
jgi:hypothetical protein